MSTDLRVVLGRLILIVQISISFLLVSQPLLAAEEEVGTEQKSVLAVEEASQKKYSVSAAAQYVDFSSMLPQTPASTPQSFSETYLWLGMSLPNKDLLTLLAEYDMYKFDHSQDDFWNTEARYNWFRKRLSESPNWVVDVQYNAGAYVPTAKYSIKTASLEGGAIAEGSLLLVSQFGKVRQTYKADVEAYRYVNGNSEKLNPATGITTGISNFAWEAHEKVNAVYEYKKFWLKLELKHYDFVDYAQRGAAFFRHWESIGYHINSNYAVEVGQAYRGNLVGQANYSNYLSFTDVERSLFFGSLIIEI